MLSVCYHFVIEVADRNTFLSCLSMRAIEDAETKYVN